MTGRATVAAGMSQVADCDAPGGKPGPVAEPSSMTVCVSSAAWKERPHWWQNRTLSGLSALQLRHTIAGYLGTTLMKGGIRLLCDSEGPSATWSGAECRSKGWLCGEKYRSEERRVGKEGRS